MSFHVPKFSRSHKDKGHADQKAHERLGIRIVSVSMAGGLQACYVKVSHGQHKAETHTIPSGGFSATIDYLCSLEVENGEESLLVELKSRKKGLFSSSHAVIGSAAIEVKKMHPVESCRHGATEPYEFNLVIHATESKEPTGEVKLQVVRCHPPKSGPNSFISCFIGTWNVGNAPPGGDLSSWLKEQYLRDVALVVVGTQECKYKERDGAKDCEDDFNSTIQAVLRDRHCLFRANRLGEMRLSIWARLDAVAGIHYLEWAEEAVGVGHVMANKGAIASVLFVWDTSICFVNSHLAAHQDKCKRRNEDFSEIVSGMNVGFPNCGILNQFHHCVWMGDLNYRLDLSRNKMFDPEIANSRSPAPELFAKITEMVESRDLDRLLECDQLVAQRESGKAFTGFTEGFIKHVPTFKVERDHDTAVYQDERAPAYCDRVLWRSLEGMAVRSLDLWCAERVTSSDHKPVGTVLQLGMRSARPEWWPRPIRDVDRGVHRQNAQHGEMLVKCWKVRVVELSGEGLTPSDMNGKADPYIAFLGDALPQWAFTEVRYRTLRPEWRLSSLPTFTIAATSKEGLREEYIIVQAMDHDRFDPDDSIGTGILPLRDLLATSDEQPFEVPLLHGGVHAGVIRGRLRLREAQPMTVSALRKQHLAKQKFEPANLCCFNLCMYRNPFKSKEERHLGPPPSQPGTMAKFTPPPESPMPPPRPAAARPDDKSPLSGPRALPPPSASHRDLAIATVPEIRRFDPPPPPAAASPPSTAGRLAPVEPWGSVGGGLAPLYGSGSLSSQHSSLLSSPDRPRRRRVPDASFDPVTSAPPAYPTRLGPGQFIPARQAPLHLSAPRPDSARDTGRAAGRDWERDIGSDEPDWPSQHRAPPATHAPSHEAAPPASLWPVGRPAAGAGGRQQGGGPHSFQANRPAYVPSWERGGFEPPTALSSGSYYKSPMYDAHYPPPRFRNV